MALIKTPEDNNVAIVAAVFLTKTGKHLARHIAKSAERATGTIISRKCVDLTRLRQHSRNVAQRRRRHVMQAADVRHHGVTTYAKY